MGTICTTCPACGTVRLEPADVRLVECSVPAWSYYAFRCPGCGGDVRHEATPAACRLLCRGGVRSQAWQVPAEALEPHTGPPIGWDDVLDLALALERMDPAVSWVPVQTVQ